MRSAFLSATGSIPALIFSRHSAAVLNASESETFGYCPIWYALPVARSRSKKYFAVLPSPRVRTRTSRPGTTPQEQPFVRLRRRFSVILSATLGISAGSFPDVHKKSGRKSLSPVIALLWCTSWWTSVKSCTRGLGMADEPLRAVMATVFPRAAGGP